MVVDEADTCYLLKRLVPSFELGEDVDEDVRRGDTAGKGEPPAARHDAEEPEAGAEDVDEIEADGQKKGKKDHNSFSVH